MNVSSFELLDARQRATVNARVAESSRSVLASYLLWWFLGLPLFLHRFYLKRRGAPLAAGAIVSLALLAAGGAVAAVGAAGSVVCVAVWIVDAFRIGDWIEDDNERRRAALADRALGIPAEPAERSARLEALARKREKPAAPPVEPHAMAPSGTIFKDDRPLAPRRRR
jgi:hypothetical protein